MKIELNYNNVTELVVLEKCGYNEFYSFARKMENVLLIKYKKKIDDYDTLWWDFDYIGNELTLKYNIYEGIIIYHFKGNKARNDDNKILFLIKNELDKKTTD